MPMEFSNKIILLTEKPRIAIPIKIALNKLGLDIAADYPALNSISVIRNGIAQSGRTAFIRTDLLRFIKEKGFPRAIIMDSQIDLGQKPIDDHSVLKIFTTFIIAYIILSKGKEYRNIKGNFILLTKGNAFNKKFGIDANPHNIMNWLSTQNPEINYFIDELKNNKEYFDEIFAIITLDIELKSNEITDTVENFLTKTAQGAQVKEPDKKNEIIPQTETAKEIETPARIIYRIDESSVYDDGNILSELTAEFSSLKEREFYIIGSWTSKTGLEVSKKIAGVLQKGISEKARFSFGDAIIFNLDDRCIIDKDTTLSLGQLFTKNLATYKKIKIIASEKNGALISKSRGFPMLKGIFTIAQEKKDAEITNGNS